MDLFYDNYKSCQSQEYTNIRNHQKENVGQDTSIQILRCIFNSLCFFFQNE